MARLIGILGGTFDPIHYGHLKTAQELMHRLGLEQVRFIPNHVPPHRQQPWLDSEARRDLVSAAIADYPGFLLDERELQRPGASYMVETLADLKRELVGDTLCLIMGADAFSHFTRWHRWQAILELCHLIIMTRPGADVTGLGDHRQLLESRITHNAGALAHSQHGQILIQSVTPVPISATLVRDRLAQGQDIVGLVPESIREQLETKYAT